MCNITYVGNEEETSGSLSLAVDIGELPAFKVLDSLPEEVAVSVVSLLPAREVRCLSTCSKAWASLCEGDEVWSAVYDRRWPEADNAKRLGNRNGVAVPRSKEEQRLVNTAKFNWRQAYMGRASEVAEQASEVTAFLMKCACNESVEVFDYHKALRTLRAARLQLGDLALTLLSRRHSVLVNLIGVHYALLHLKAEASEVDKILKAAGIGGRQVCLRWWIMGSMARGGFRLRDAMHTSTLDLDHLTNSAAGRSSGHLQLMILERGILHEVLRVQVSADFRTSAWVARSMHSQR
eukprot:jgi/Mesen1/6248/ME000323S05378